MKNNYEERDRCERALLTHAELASDSGNCYMHAAKSLEHAARSARFALIATANKQRSNAKQAIAFIHIEWIAWIS